MQCVINMAVTFLSCMVGLLLADGGSESAHEAGRAVLAACGAECMREVATCWGGLGHFWGYLGASLAAWVCVM